MLEFLKKAIQQFSNHNILIIGDIMLDQYTFGQVSRVSPEAPVPILKKQADQYVLGGAANVAHNLAALGAKVSICGFVGDDPRRYIVLKLLKEKGIGASGIVTRKNQPTTLKLRFVSGGHQLLRLDDETDANVPSAEEAELLDAIKKVLPRAAAAILSDYDKGCFSEKLAREIIELCRKENKIVVADIKPQNKNWFKGVHLLTPNLKEGREITGLMEPEEVGQKLSADFGADVLLTLGAEGMRVFRKGGSSKSISSKKVKGFDVSGAGDTVVAVAALGLLSGLDLEAAAILA